MLNLEESRRQAEQYVIVSKSIPQTVRRVDVGTQQEVKPSLKEIPIEERKPRSLSPQQKLQEYLKSIGSL